ncbi:LRR_2 domain-containing protein [Cephalotus follicularis]|uniref:LRR_2 domain-containing protein n=1 Tax=Cephalotus follicularis TaxID=3775 RepID=A0A1Q3AYD5_CEPFO|nr:LRR_2 domain-containing protein [Cephalotus follicularis]
MPPADLFTSSTLVVLKLDITLELNVPTRVCLPSLKVLHLKHVAYAADDSLERLIASCPVLEDFESCNWDKIRKLTISSRTLKRLTIINFIGDDVCVFDTVINAPSLVYLRYLHHVPNGCSLTANLYSVVEATIGSLTEFFKGISNVRSLHLVNDAVELNLLTFSLLYFLALE